VIAAHRVLAHLPVRGQRAVLDRVVRWNLAPRFGLFRMFLETLVEVGADRRELEEAFHRCRDIGPSFVGVFRELSARTAASASSARDRYRSAIYALLADWACADVSERRRNYALALPEFAVYSRDHDPVITPVVVPFRDVGLHGFFVSPERASAAVVLVPGNDEPKEWMVPFAEAACARGLAALAVDLPGYGENALGSTRLDGREALADCARGAVEFLRSRELRRVGVLGVSLGGLLVHLMAALEPEIRASAGLGGPYDLEWTFTHVPYLQRQRFSLAAGVFDGKELRALVRRLDAPALLREIRGPALVVHGTRDIVVPVRQGRALAEAIGLQAELRLVEGGDHMANPHLQREIAVVMDWLRERLAER
jgi:pimeloyl-ACP methyl ester carboxylesterase